VAKKSVTKESYQTMSNAELSAKLAESQESYFRLRFRHTNNPLKNPMVIRRTRREIARLKTFLHQIEKEAAHGTKAR